MLINKIQCLNIDKLYEIACEKDRDESYGNNMFSTKIGQLYSHMEIGYELKEVNMMEYFFLKMYSSRITKFESYEAGVPDIDLIERSYPELVTKYGDGSTVSYPKNLYETFKFKRDKSYNLYSFDLASPIGFKYGRCFVSFTGQELINLLGTDPKQFFLLNGNIDMVLLPVNDNENERGKRNLNPDYNYKEDIKLTNAFISIFLNNFYKFIVTYSSNIDLLSEFFTKKFDNVGNKKYNEPIIASYRHPLSIIDYIEDSSKDILEKVDLCRKEQENESSYFLRDYYSKTIIEFNFSTSLFIFCKLFEIFPKGSITSRDNILEVNQKSRNIEYLDITTPEEMGGKIFKSEVERKELQKFVNRTIEIYDNSEFVLKSLFTTMSYAPINFTISVTKEVLESVFQSLSLSTSKSSENIIYFIINKMYRIMKQNEELFGYKSKKKEPEVS